MHTTLVVVLARSMHTVVLSYGYYSRVLFIASMHYAYSTLASRSSNAPAVLCILHKRTVLDTNTLLRVVRLVLWVRYELWIILYYSMHITTIVVVSILRAYA